MFHEIEHDIHICAFLRILISVQIHFLVHRFSFDMISLINTDFFNQSPSLREYEKNTEKRIENVPRNSSGHTFAFLSFPLNVLINLFLQTFFLSISFTYKTMQAQLKIKTKSIDCWSNFNSPYVISSV